MNTNVLYVQLMPYCLDNSNMQNKLKYSIWIFKI